MTTSSLTEQQQAILAAAVESISESSLLDFKMASIAKLASTAMGTVYKHFHAKEDVLVALAAQLFQREHQAYSKILQLPINVPERLLAFFLMDARKVQTYEFGAHLEMMVSNEAVLHHASEAWLDRLVRADLAIESLFMDFLEDACESGELKAPESERPALFKELIEGLWSLSLGFLAVTFQKRARTIGKKSSLPSEPRSIDHSIVNCARRWLSTYTWKTPISDAEILRACSVLEEHGYR